MMVPQFTPARAKAASEKRLAEIWGHPEWIAEEKLDGWRYLMLLGGGLPRVYMTGRRVSSRTGLLSEKGLNVPCLWPEGSILKQGLTVLDGEVMPPVGAGFRDMASIMSADPAEAATTMARIGYPFYRVFDVLYDTGTDVRLHCQAERKNILLNIVDDLRHPLIGGIASLPPTLQCYDDIVAVGGEGVILKRTDAVYGESGAWLKVKKYSTLDVVVTGFTEAKFGVSGKYDGQIGAVVVSVYLGDGKDTNFALCEVGQVSGMTDDVRLDITQNPEKYLNTVIEVAAQEFGKERLRHPRWRRHRPDANPAEATYEKMMRDLGAATEKRVVSGDQLDLF